MTYCGPGAGRVKAQRLEATRCAQEEQAPGMLEHVSWVEVAGGYEGQTVAATHPGIPHPSTLSSLCHKRLLGHFTVDIPLSRDCILFVSETQVSLG